jgi:hypothetical protein
MDSTGRPMFERQALELSLREWLVVGLLVTLFLAVAPSIPFRSKSPTLDPDYRIPYPLSRRYDLYKRYTALAAARVPTLLVGDSVVWGQCAHREDTLAHHLNALTHQPRFANAGLDGMHPVALLELLQYHAPAIEKTRVLLQFDPLWLMSQELEAHHAREVLYNRPDLIPRLAANFTGPFKTAVSAAWEKVLEHFPINEWGDRLADAKLDFLAWSLDHPYESPLKAIASTLPPSDDSSKLRLVPWDFKPTEPLDSEWDPLNDNVQWTAFHQILDLLISRGNRVLVVLGPMNEHYMDAKTQERYHARKKEILEDLARRNVRCFAPSVLQSQHYADICHPLGGGYEELARELLQKESAWLLGLEEPR